MELRRVCLVALIALPAACTADPLPQLGPHSTPAVSKTVKSVVKDYLAAVASNDYPGRVEATTGELRDWNTWINDEGFLSGVEKSKLTIDEMEVENVSHGVASVALKAQLTFTTGKVVRISGPVVLKERVGDWKIFDYRRNGRSQRKAVMSDVAGRNKEGGVAVRAVALVLQKDYVDVFAEVRTKRIEALEPLTARLEARNGPVLRQGVNGPTVDGFLSVCADGTGRTHQTRGRYGNPRTLIGDSVVLTDFYWPGEKLPFDTTKLRLVMHFLDRSDKERLRIVLPISVNS